MVMIELVIGFFLVETMAVGDMLYIDGLTQDCSNSSALAMELL